MAFIQKPKYSERRLVDHPTTMTIHLASIRARLILAFSVLLILLLAVAALSLLRLDGFTATTQEIVNFQVRRVFITQRMNLHAQAAAMDEEMAASSKAVNDLGQTGVALNVQADIDHVTRLQRRCTILLQETVELIEIEGPAKARDYFEDRTHRVLNTLLFESRALEAHLQQVMHIVPIQALALPGEDYSKDLDFTPSSIRARWDAGREFANRKIAVAPWRDTFDPAMESLCTGGFQGSQMIRPRIPYCFMQTKGEA